MSMLSVTFQDEVERLKIQSGFSNFFETLYQYHQRQNHEEVRYVHELTMSRTKR